MTVQYIEMVCVERSEDSVRCEIGRIVWHSIDVRIRYKCAHMRVSVCVCVFPLLLLSFVCRLLFHWLIECADIFCLCDGGGGGGGDDGSGSSDGDGDSGGSGGSTNSRNVSTWVSFIAWCLCVRCIQKS